ncbi:MAG: hypothetical protein R3C20_15890 [Planctomycetaceae bacterium]
MADGKMLLEPRARLSSISWLVRFKATVLPNEAAIAACMAYVGLNPVRAGLAATP